MPPDTRDSPPHPILLPKLKQSSTKHASIAFIILAHEHPEAVRRLVEFVAPEAEAAAVHYDGRAPEAEFRSLQAAFDGDDRVLLLPRRRCAWGTWSLAAATLDALRALERRGIAPDFVCLLSGADFPLRPVADLRRHLARNGGREFIEAFDLAERQWVRGGMTEGRYRYFHPFGKRDWPTLFALAWRLQKALGLQREPPRGLHMRFGSQWWCLTFETCRAILRLCEDRPDIPRFFRSVWIPDECFFQTLAAHIAGPSALTQASVTHYEFGPDGRPRVFGAEEIAGLNAEGRYFVRKVDAGDLSLWRYALQAGGHRKQRIF